MEILTFLVQNWDSVLVVLGFILVCALLIKHNQTKMLHSMILALVAQAEKTFGAGTGDLKFAAVSRWIYERIPRVLQLLFSPDDIEDMIEAAVADLKHLCAKNAQVQDYLAATK